MTHLLIVSPDVVGKRMAAVAIRCWNIAAALARRGLKVTLATPGQESLPGEGFDLVGYREGEVGSLAPHLAGVDAVLVSGYTLFHFPALRDVDVPMIVDLWAPFVLEELAQDGGPPESRMAAYRRGLGVINEQLQVGDFYVCASEKQRDFWLGMLAANGRLNPYVYGQDPTFGRLLSVVPFGLPAQPPRHTQPVLKGVHPGIGQRDRVILWNGGIWDWYDPVTLIQAMQQVLAVRQDVRLVFLGVHHPNPDVSQSRQLDRAIGSSKELGLYGRHVFFEEWVPYEEVQNYLLEADIGAVLHYNHVETRFSFRARILSCFWAQLPILITEGSPSSDIVREEQLGRVVGYEDANGTAKAILDMLALPDPRAHYRPQFERIVERYSWDRVVEPLVGFCRAPHFADDRGQLGESAFYLSEIARLRKLVAGYESGRFIRFTKWLRRAQRRLLAGRE